MDVFLNVYDITESNVVLHSLGGGLYHSGIEINGFEFSFSPSGIVKNRPREYPGQFREQIHLGLHHGGMLIVNNIIEDLAFGMFGGGRYDVVFLNCNDFSDEFCSRLLDKRIPEWINRAAKVARGMAKDTRSDNSFKQLGHTSGSHLSFNQESKNSSAASNIFSWLGWFSPSQETSAVMSKQAIAKPDGKKELTEKQKELLQKIRTSHNS